MSNQRLERQTSGTDGDHGESIGVVEVFEALDAAFAEPGVDCRGEDGGGVVEGCCLDVQDLGNSVSLLSSSGNGNWWWTERRKSALYVFYVP